MRELVEIGPGKIVARGWRLSEVALVPTRRTRDIDDVSTEWQLDAYRFEIPAVAHPSDATMSPASVIEMGRLGGLGVLNGEGLWCRYVDPTSLLKELADTPAENAIERLQEIYAEPVKPELIAERIAEIRAGGITTAIRFSPQHTAELAPLAVEAGVDLLVIQGTIVSAEHVSSGGDVLNLKQFIADLDIPVVVGGATNYKTAMHLMRTGAAGVIVGVGSDDWSTTDTVLGIDVPMASAIVEAAAARRDYLDETGGRYVHLIADGEITNSGAIAKALACGADSVMLGSILADAAESPAAGAWWHSAASHPKLPRGRFRPGDSGDVEVPDLEAILYGPSNSSDGSQNLFGGLRRAMAKTGYTSVKEFQKASLVTA
ncbi:GuaB3 family IMP dehydrogenase-related protein [Glycomyces dulcitolivorans]|uniref:GuaB3 family IMP dehydrogenase-related protein n=1 Tax=Glycomyces dulcitolivorans TaxID=2200759 RepID=UPI000DD41416|nr:GuaB3 family IMP dehydrogenase-related protein [Glycomyces dulcitolivorans]